MQPSEIGKPERYFAHSLAGRPLEEWQPLAEHLHNVAAEVDRLAARLGAGPWGRAAGLRRDLGMYSSAFQRRLTGDPSRVDHATAGALEAGRRPLDSDPLARRDRRRILPEAHPCHDPPPHPKHSDRLLLEQLRKTPGHGLARTTMILRKDKGSRHEGRGSMVEIPDHLEEILIDILFLLSRCMHP